MSNKLLLADDSITIQKVVGIIFANEDYELTVVDNGDAALEKAKQVNPDIILVDALMPGKTGYEVCAEVRRDPRLKHIPLLLLTGAFEPFDEDKAKQSGADDFISKPFESQQLIDRVKKLIDMGKQRASAAETISPPVIATPVAEPAAPSVAAASDLAQAFAGEVLTEEPEEVFSLGEEAVAGTVDDDLWGAFDIDDISTAKEYQIGAVQDLPASAGSPAVEMDDPFSFADVEEELVAPPPAPKADSTEQQQFGTGWESVDEQAYSYDDVKADVFAEPAETSAAATLSEFSFDEEAEVETDQFLEETADLVEPFSAPVMSEFDPDAASVFSSAAPVVTAAQEPPATLTEAQITAILSNLSREVIERIVWEVVPDLAEVLIKEEIRKLKGGLGS